MITASLFRIVYVWIDVVLDMSITVVPKDMHDGVGPGDFASAN